jgi:hypothetical protein
MFLRICIWRNTPDGAKEEICMPVGIMVPDWGYIDPIHNIIRPEQWAVSLGGKKLAVSSDLRSLAAIAAAASRLKDERLRDAIMEGLQAASELATAALPEGVSVNLAEAETACKARATSATRQAFEAGEK